MNAMKHPNVVPIECAFVEHNAVCLQLSYFEKNVRTWMSERHSEWEVKDLFRSILRGLAYLHANDVVHRYVRNIRNRVPAHDSF